MIDLKLLFGDFIDLTQTITDNMPVFPGDIPVSLKSTVTYEKNGIDNHSLCCSMHIGTHIDTPGHFTEIDKKITDFPVSKFIGNGVCIDVSNYKVIEKDLLLNNALEDIVLFYTGWDKRFYEPDYFYDYPVLSEDCAKYLVDNEVKMIGVDFPSVDRAPYAVHKILLRKDILIIENLTNLQELCNQKFVLVALPLKVNSHGAPARVVAQITD